MFAKNFPQTSAGAIARDRVPDALRRDETGPRRRAGFSLLEKCHRQELAPEHRTFSPNALELGFARQTKGFSKPVTLRHTFAASRRDICTAKVFPRKVRREDFAKD